MKPQARILMVLVCLVLAVGGVYALSTTPSPQKLSLPDKTQAAEVAAQKPAEARPLPENNLSASASSPPVSLSPDLSRTSAFTFLDPVLVGKKAPEFVAKEANGKPVRLADFKNKKNVVMVFYQGSFCSVCAAQLSNIQSHLTDFKNQDAEILAISADDNAHALTTVGENGLTFHVIPDTDKKIIKQYGVGNISKKGIAWPSLFVVDKKGMVQFNFANTEGHRLHSNEILPVLSRMTGKPSPSLTYEQ